jgi:hypothetical protein
MVAQPVLLQAQEGNMAAVAVVRIIKIPGPVVKV